MKPQLFLLTEFAMILLGCQCITSSDVQIKLSRCRQSSTYHSAYGCNKAIDGNRNQELSGLSCSHVGSESSGWWSAQVEKTALMKEVRIYNRKDCCAERLTNFTISVDGSVCRTYTGAAFSEQNFGCGKKGFELRITSSKAYMTLCEVVVTGQYIDDKLTLTKCQQSSTLGVGVCARAIDGNLNQAWGGDSCSHVGSESVGWWKAETSKRARFNYVHIFNRQDCCAERLTKFDISVNDKVCHVYNEVAFSDKFLSCFKYGTVLKIYSSKPYLTLCEVVVIGRYLDTRLNTFKCAQSSTFKTYGCSKAIDGNSYQHSGGISCSQLGSESTGWWKAEIEKPALFDTIHIYNRKDCCVDSLTNFKIFVDGVLCHNYNGEVFSDRSFSCFRKGTELKIVSSKPNMTLCEVIALGEYDDKSIRLSKCNQSSTYNTNHVCDKAIDGNPDQLSEGISCSRLYTDNTGWWQAETDKLAVIDFVKIYNSQENCCDKTLTDFEIYVNSVLCREYKGEPFSVKIFPCFKTGTVLKIASKDSLMTLCEVEAFGEYVSEYAD